MKKAVALLSGGLDSTTTVAIARDKGFRVFALTVHYGQRNLVEIESAKRVARYFDIDHKLINLDLTLFGGSALTDDISVPQHKDTSEQEIPVTYVPARNTIMLSLALAYMETLGAADIFFGANVHDYCGYPDCRPHYVEAYEKMANLATKSSVSGQKIAIHAPLVNLSKKEIIERGIFLGIDYSITHSCYSPINDKACGNCSACHYRAKGFLEAQIKDPTVYAQGIVSDARISGLQEDDRA